MHASFTGSVFLGMSVDGFIARRTNTTSELGRWLDPVADRITVIVVVIAFVAGGLVPWPVLPLLLVPDLLLSAYALFVLAGASFPVTWVGKIRTALIFVGLLLVLVGFTPWFWAFTVLLVLTGLLSVTFNTLGNSTVQLGSDPALRGRVMSLYMLVFMGGTPLGSIVVGWVTERWGAPLALILSGGVCVLAAGVSAVLAARSRGVALHVDLHRGAEHHVGLVQHAA